MAFPCGATAERWTKPPLAGCLAVTHVWERHLSSRSGKHSPVCDLQHSIRLVTRVASLRLSGSGTAAKEHCLARVRPRRCPCHLRLIVPTTGDRAKPRARASPPTDVRACFRPVPAKSPPCTSVGETDAMAPPDDDKELRSAYSNQLRSSSPRLQAGCLLRASRQCRQDRKLAKSRCFSPRRRSRWT